MKEVMDLVFFPNPKNVEVLPPAGLKINEYVSISTKDMREILKYHASKKHKISNIVFRFGDPMDNGSEFFKSLLTMLDNPKYQDTKVIIETPMIYYLQKNGAWLDVLQSEKVHVKAMFKFRMKDSYGKFFSEADLEKAYSRFWGTFRYRPELIYYADGKDDIFLSHIERVSNVVGAKLEIRYPDPRKKNETEIFYTNDGSRYLSSTSWFHLMPETNQINTSAEMVSIAKANDEVNRKMMEEKEKHERRLLAQKLEQEKEDALLRQYNINKAKEELEAKKKRAPRRHPVAHEYTPEQKMKMREAKEKALETLNKRAAKEKAIKEEVKKKEESKPKVTVKPKATPIISKPPYKEAMSLYNAIERHRKQANITGDIK